MFIKVTTVDGPALINIDEIHAIVPYRDEGITGCDLWWKDHVKDGISMRLGERCTWIDEEFDEICAQLAGDHNAPR